MVAVLSNFLACKMRRKARLSGTPRVTNKTQKIILDGANTELRSQQFE